MMYQADPSEFPVDPDQLALQMKIERLISALYRIVKAYPAGLSEHTLLKKLQAPEWAILEPIDFREPAKLYPVHFLLFHALYRLRDQLLKSHGEWLAISALTIGIETRQQQGRPAAGVPGPQDSLALFYLDLDNLNLSNSAIESMLDNFWRGVGRPEPKQLQLACLELDIPCPPDDMAMANRQFRRLAMAHHPDRGGDKQRLQQINQAIAIVRQHFR